MAVDEGEEDLNGDNYIVTYIKGDVSDLPYKSALASQAIDLWSFGVLLYCCNHYLRENLYSMLIVMTILKVLTHFKTDDKNCDRLANVSDNIRRDLLKILLSKDPDTITDALNHKFFTLEAESTYYPGLLERPEAFTDMEPVTDRKLY